MVVLAEIEERLEITPQVIDPVFFELDTLEKGLPADLATHISAQQILMPLVNEFQPHHEILGLLGQLHTPVFIAKAEAEAKPNVPVFESMYSGAEKITFSAPGP